MSFKIGETSVRVGGIAKGSGMIHPNMGTMLAFLTTDCAITSDMLELAIQEVTKKTFNRVCVDGDTSTNDMAVILANGLAGNEQIEWQDESYHLFIDALTAVCTALARAIAADGEGASRLITCQVRRSRSEEAAERLAKAGGGLQPGQGGHVRRRCQLGAGCCAPWGIPRRPSAGVCQHLLPFPGGAGGRVRRWGRAGL